MLLCTHPTRGPHPTPLHLTPPHACAHLVSVLLLGTLPWFCPSWSCATAQSVKVLPSAMQELWLALTLAVGTVKLAVKLASAVLPEATASSTCCRGGRGGAGQELL